MYKAPKICGIYRISHKETGMTYVGQSIDILKRWEEHFSRGLASAQPLSFRFEILEQCSSKKLKEREQYWIERYNCLRPNGYNRNSAPKIKLIDQTVSMMEESNYSAEDIRQIKKAHLKNIWEKTRRESASTCKDSD